MGFLLPISEVVGSNPASPISRYSGEIGLSEEIPEEWWNWRHILSMRQDLYRYQPNEQ